MLLKNEQGFVLITTLLFLLVVNLLALSVLDIGLLETKMEAAYLDKLKSFYQTEYKLSLAERMVVAGEEMITPDIDVAVLEDSICGVIFFQLTAHGSYNGAKTTLQSSVARLVDASRCSVKPNVRVGRQSFSVIF